MTSTAARQVLERWIADLRASVAERPDVQGLVLLGSSADLDRVDEWSDCDLFLITREGAQESYRTRLDWLPGASAVALVVRETAHGLKVVYDDGRVVELAVFSLEELAVARVNAYRVAYDTGGVAQAVAAVAGRGGETAVDPGREARMFVSLLLIGVGRARRGEVIAAGQHIRSHALGHLLRLWHVRAEPDPALLDDLDPFRRVERADPELGRRVGRALAAEPEVCARRLLDLAEELFAPGWDGWPAEGVAAVRRRLGW